MNNVELTTLCYLEKDNSYLMMHRVKKRNDENHDKYIGVGGHIEYGETPEECIRREIKEETGLIAGELKLRGLLTFLIDGKHELSWLYTSNDFRGNLSECDEGSLEWVEKSKIYELPLWEGDKKFFELLENSEDYFSLKLVYENDKLIEYKRLM